MNYLLCYVHSVERFKTAGIMSAKDFVNVSLITLFLFLIGRGCV